MSRLAEIQGRIACELVYMAGDGIDVKTLEELMILLDIEIAKEIGDE